MKIAILTASFAGGGAERVQITLAREFQARGLDPCFLAFSDEGPLRSDLPSEIDYHCFDVTRVSRGIGSLARYLKEEIPDVLIVAMSHVGVISGLAAWRAGWRGRLVIRLDSSRSFFLKSQGFLTRQIHKLLERVLFPRAFAVIAVSAGIAGEYRRQLGLANCHLIHNPVQVDAPSGEPQSVALNHPFFASNSGAPVIVAVGRLSREKGFDFLLEAFARLRAERAARLLILGEGIERGRLEAVIHRLGLAEEVDLPGFVTAPRAYLARASAYALSSEYESFGLALVEALSLGLPVVATRTEGALEIINDSALGTLVDFEDRAGYADALGRALNDPGIARERRRARAADFAPEKIVGRYLELLEVET